jgi:hypothetical protein
MGLTAWVLTKEQQDFGGFSLHDDEDFVVLKYNGKEVGRFNSRKVTVDTIRQAVNQIIQESKSGISFGKVVN